MSRHLWRSMVGVLGTALAVAAPAPLFASTPGSGIWAQSTNGRRALVADRPSRRGLREI